MSTKVHVGASKIHKWLALIIGIQVLLWVVSGSVMSILPIEDGAKRASCIAGTRFNRFH